MNAATGRGATFAIVLGSGSYADAFRHVNHTLTGIFTSGHLGSIVTASSAALPSQGRFSFNGSSLQWIAADPEPENAVVGLLVAGGILAAPAVRLIFPAFHSPGSLGKSDLARTHNLPPSLLLNGCSREFWPARCFFG